MKKFSFVAMLLCAGMAMVSCENENEWDIDQDGNKEDKAVVVDFEGNYFSMLVDEQQYNGPLIYSGDEYKWTDEKTSLTGVVVKEDWTMWGMGYGWGNGFAISNYIDKDANSFDTQLAVPVSNGSQNFAVCYENDSEIHFADGEAHKVLTMQYCPTSYLLSNELQNAADGYEFQAIITLKHADESTTVRTVYLAKNKSVQQGWETIDLGDVEPWVSATFTFDGSDKGDWGLNTPKYIAIDNIVVLKK